MTSAESSSQLGPRGTSVCRGCGRDGLVSVLDLGLQPLANEMGRTPEEQLPAFPLHLRICPTCGLGQVGEFVTPDRIFGAEYPYLSSTSTSWVAHARGYVDHVSRELHLGPDDLVVEIASNDGYLLRGMQEVGVRVQGVEPVATIAELARVAGVPTTTAFFGEGLARKLVEQHGTPRLVVANNVMAHVPDLHDFVAGLASLAADDTVVTVENPSLVSLMLERQFDTIYHEHFSYLTSHAVATTVEPHGLELFRVEQLPTHGGSNRYWLRRRTGASRDPSVARSLQDEERSGLLDPATWEEFADASRRAVDGLSAWLDGCAAEGRVVVGYGAAAKGNTHLNASAVTHPSLRYVVDGSVAKQGRYLPGSRIPVLAPEHLSDDGPTDVLVLPWNLATELSTIVARLAPAAAIWIAVPEMSRID